MNKEALIFSLLGVAALFGLCVVAVGLPRRPASRIPPDPPATPLTVEELRAYPALPVPPGATVTGIARGTYDRTPDGPSPRRPRYGRRETSMATGGPPEAVAAFFRAALPERGWRYCSSSDSPATTLDWYARGDDPCAGTGLVTLRVSIAPTVDNTYRVLIIEDLPAPRSWPDPPVP